MSARRSWRAVGLVAGLALLTGCGAVGAQDAATPTAAPVPGSTLAPDLAATGAPVPDGMALAVVVPADPDVATAPLADAVDRWAAAHDVEHVRHVVTGDDDLVALVESAGTDGATVVVPGGELVDAVDSASSQHLEVPFLLLGAQLPEPTENVTAVVWPGATSRGSRAPADEPDESAEAAAVTADRADAAVAAGLAGLRAGTTGVVLDLGP